MWGLGGSVGLQIGLAIESCAERHVVQGAGHAVGSFVWWHALDAVLGLIWGQFTAQLIGQYVWLQEEREGEITTCRLVVYSMMSVSYLIGSQDSE